MNGGWVSGGEQSDVRENNGIITYHCPHTNSPVSNLILYFIPQNNIHPLKNNKKFHLV